MGYSKDQLLARLKELHIDFSQYEHPVVLTVEAQAKYVGHLGGALSKNLLLKDKKSRFYLVSALADTKVDLKVLSQRLGLGKGGLRMAPEEALDALLQVPPGCVTPFALVNDSARHISLLLDEGFKSQERCFFHPLSNDVSISLNAHDLDKFLRSIEKDSSYVDLEANPVVGKDQPPDLAALVPSGATTLQDSAESVAPLQNHTDKSVAPVKKATAVSAKASKPLNNAQSAEKPADCAQMKTSITDPSDFVEEILRRVSSVVLSEITEENMRHQGEQLGPVVSGLVRKRLSLDLQSLATLFKNTAYTEGFHAGTGRLKLLLDDHHC